MFSFFKEGIKVPVPVIFDEIILLLINNRCEVKSFFFLMDIKSRAKNEIQNVKEPYFSV